MTGLSSFDFRQIIMTNVLKINPADNVVVAIQPQPAGAVIEVDGQKITVLEDVPAGHKIAIRDLAEGENVIKYGFPIGHAREAKRAGSWMNEHTIKTNLAGLLEYEYHPKQVVLNIPDDLQRGAGNPNQSSLFREVPT